MATIQVAIGQDPATVIGSAAIPSGTTLLLQAGGTYNLPAALTATDHAAKLVISRYGSGANPIVQDYAMWAANAWTEVDPAQLPGAVVAQPGSKVWYAPFVSTRFRGLFSTALGPRYGVQVDFQNQVGGGVKTPSAAYEWGSVASPSTGYVVYADGADPVTLYGGLYGHRAADTGVFQITRPIGGVEIFGIDFQLANRPIYFDAGTAGVMYPNCWVYECTFDTVFRAVTFSGGNGVKRSCGFQGLRVHDCEADYLGAGFATAVTSATGTVVVGCALDDGRLHGNRIAGACKAYSDGGFYFGGRIYSTNGSRLLIDGNTVSDVEAGHFWPTDGYALYQDNYAKDIEYARNFVWNCQRPMISNSPSGNNVVLRNNVMVAKAATDTAIVLSDGQNAGHAGDVHVLGNVMSGFATAISGTQGYTTNHYTIRGNVSKGSGTALYRDAVRTKDAATLSAYTVDGNNFYGHRVVWSEYTNNNDQSPSATNVVATDPTALLASLPTPSDTSVHYARRVSPKSWSGTPSLSRGLSLPA